MGRNLTIAVCACASVTAGCDAVRPPASLDGIEPANVSPAVDTVAVLFGEGLFADGRARLDGDLTATIDRRWRVWIDDVELDEIAWIDPEQIDVTIPRGLAVGAHDVIAVGPDGQEATLIDGLTVGALPTGWTIDDAFPAGETTVLGEDPFGDGTAFAYIVGFHDQLYVGPSRDGSKLLRFDPDGSGVEIIPLSFIADTTGHTGSNTMATYATLGATGCAGAACGPDGEDGRGVLASGTTSGTEWLLLGGARSDGDLDYVYLADVVTTTATFRPVDLSDRVGCDDGDCESEGAEVGVLAAASACVANDRWYLGFVGDGDERPSLLALATMPGPLGLDATDTDAQQLDIDLMQATHTPIEMVETVGEFGDRVHVFQRAGWWRATTEVPAPFMPGSPDWLRITPQASGYAIRTSVAPTKIADFEPADRAVPQIAAFGGRLYVARNTTADAQLWSCDPAVSDDLAQCDRGDWTLVAQPDDPGRTSISMLAATATHLYVGYDDPDGLAVLRSADGSEFAPVGDPGLGDPTRTRIFHAVAPSFGDAVYLIAGDGTGAIGIHVVR